MIWAFKSFPQTMILVKILVLFGISRTIINFNISWLTLYPRKPKSDLNVHSQEQNAVHTSLLQHGQAAPCRGHTADTTDEWHRPYHQYLFHITSEAQIFALLQNLYWDIGSTSIFFRLFSATGFVGFHLIGISRVRFWLLFIRSETTMQQTPYRQQAYRKDVGQPPCAANIHYTFNEH